VGYGWLGDGPGPDKLVRDHLAVVDASSAEFSVGEACLAIPGGPAIDETSGEIVGIASRSGGTNCSGPAAVDIYTRTEAFLTTIEQALAKSSFPQGAGAPTRKERKGPIDLGAFCTRGADCAAGVCVSERNHEYCSRLCDAHDASDRCPTHFLCRKSSQSESVCVEG
jgi:hypothetical protein